MATRAAPSQPVPAIARLVPARWAQRATLRPAVMMIAFFGAIYALFAAAAVIRRRNDQDTSSKLDTLYLALAILYFITAGVEFFGLAAVFRSSIQLVKTYFLASVAVAFIVTGAELTRLVLHFIDKSSIISACIAGETAADSTASSDTTSIADYCNSVWNRNVYLDVGLLLFSFVLSVLFASVVASYLKQLLNPALTRQQVVNVAPSSQYAYPLAAYPPNPYGQPSQPMAPPVYQPGFVPAYEPGGFVVPPEKPEGEAEGRSTTTNPFSDRNGMTTQEYEQRQHDEMVREEEERRRRAMESTETVTLEPRRENEGRV